MLGLVVVSLWTSETCGNTVALEAPIGTAALSHGQKAKALLLLSSANTAWNALSLGLRRPVDKFANSK